MSSDIDNRARLYAEGAIEHVDIDAAAKRATERWIAGNGGNAPRTDREMATYLDQYETAMMETITDAMSNAFKIGFHAGLEEHGRRRK